MGSNPIRTTNINGGTQKTELPDLENRQSVIIRCEGWTPSTTSKKEDRQILVCCTNPLSCVCVKSSESSILLSSANLDIYLDNLSNLYCVDGKLENQLSVKQSSLGYVGSIPSYTTFWLVGYLCIGYFNLSFYNYFVLSCSYIFYLYVHKDLLMVKLAHFDLSPIFQ